MSANKQKKIEKLERIKKIIENQEVSLLLEIKNLDAVFLEDLRNLLKFHNILLMSIPNYLLNIILKTSLKNSLFLVKSKDFNKVLELISFLKSKISKDFFYINSIFSIKNGNIFKIDFKNIENIFTSSIGGMISNSLRVNLKFPKLNN